MCHTLVLSGFDFPPNRLTLLPNSIALEELYQDRLVVRRVTPEELETERLLAEEKAQAKETDASTDLDDFTEALRNA